MLRAACICIALLFAVAQHAIAEEVIERFFSTVTVNADATLDVTEEIRVIAEGDQIRRGIYRDFPTDYKYPDGTSVIVGFDVKSVERNGAAEKWTTERLDNGVRVRIGNRDVLLEHGPHTYRIRYHTTRQLGFFEQYDELYWNVTGNGWSFPIEEARVKVTLPAGANIGQSALYTGRQGETGKDARVIRQSGSVFEAETTRALQPYEGFTAAVNWQKGIVAAPTPNQRLWWWIADNLGYGLLGLTLLSVFGYYLMAWARVGRDPRGGTIIPLFHPPEGLGPAAVRYIWKQGYDDRAFAAALVGLAVKGRLKISQDKDDDYTVTRLADQGPALSSSESALFRSLPSSSLTLDNINHAKINHAKSSLRGQLDGEYRGNMFVKNMGWFVLGLILSAVGLVLSGFFLPAGVGAVLTFAGLFGAVWWGVVLSVGYGIVKGLFSSAGALQKISGAFRLLLLVPFALAGVGVPLASGLASGVTPAMIAFVVMALILGLVNIVFLKLLAAPTPAGRLILDQIEGFRKYMTTAEEKRLDALHPPEKTPELFERYLPYAMALDCENEWNDKFAAVLAAAAVAGASSPVWYSGSHGGWSSDGFARDLSNSLASSVSSASVPPGSSSGTGGWSGGSSGGGSSGGGGGGGGGGGW